MNRETIPIKTVDQVIAAHEKVFNLVSNGDIKEGTANAMTAQLKSVANLYKLKIDAVKVCIDAKAKGLVLPQGILEGEK